MHGYLRVMLWIRRPAFQHDKIAGVEAAHPWLGLAQVKEEIEMSRRGDIGLTCVRTLFRRDCTDDAWGLGHCAGTPCAASSARGGRSEHCIPRTHFHQILRDPAA